MPGSEPCHRAVVAIHAPRGPGRWVVRRFKHTVKFACSALVVLLAVMIPVVAEPDKLPTDAAAALHAPTNVVLYSLEPDERPTAEDKTLYGWKILGQVKLDKKQAKLAIAAVESAISQGDGFAGAHCFAPRHALRVTVKDQTYDFVICYACGHISVSRGETTIARLGAVGSPGSLNALLTAAKIPLAKTYDQ